MLSKDDRSKLQTFDHLPDAMGAWKQLVRQNIPIKTNDFFLNVQQLSGADGSASEISNAIHKWPLNKSDNQRYQHEIPYDDINDKKLFGIMQEKAKRPQEFVSVISDCEVVAERDDGFVRKATISLPGKDPFHIHEDVAVDPNAKSISFVQTDGNFCAINELVTKGTQRFFSGTYVYSDGRSDSAFKAELENTFSKMRQTAETA